MHLISNSRFLMMYSGLLTLAFVSILVLGIGGQSRKQDFAEITVHRINVVEPDGTLRLVISDKAEFPGSFIKGKEIARGDRKAAGMLFLDDEGTEMGGLIFGASKDKNGQVTGHGHLSFDQYMQDQTFSIDAGEESGKRFSAINISDRGDYPITDALEAVQRIQALPEDQRQAEWKKFAATHPGDHTRIAFGRTGDKSVVLRMKDTEGRDRIIIKVNPDGTPLMEFLDADGKVISQLPQAQK